MSHRKFKKVIRDFFIYDVILISRYHFFRFPRVEVDFQICVFSTCYHIDKKVVVETVYLGNVEYLLGTS
jgi:hypothetical protein